jgi:hypothetical protein
MSFLRRYVTYANVVATLALLFAMSGGALAAKHYPQGVAGGEGPEGRPASVQLSPDASESGVYGIGASRSNGGHVALAVTFPTLLPATIPVANVFYTESSTPVPHCSGPGHADPGYLCIYSSVIEGLDVPALVDPESGETGVATGRLGFGLTWKSTSTKALGEEEVDFGTYTVTAP